VKALCYSMAPFMPEGAERLAAILNVTLPENGPDGGEDVWAEGLTPLPAGSPIQTPEALFPKIDKDRVAELADAHLRGEAF